MNTKTSKLNTELKFEWTCRILLTLTLLRAASGYVVFIQTRYQLISPVIPQSMIYEISKPYMFASLITSVVFLSALWFYFFRKRITTIVLCIVAIIGYELSIPFFV